MAWADALPPQRAQSRDPELGPAELVLATAVSRRFYLDGRSKVEIADEFGLSRFKVARMLERAVSTGLVRIEIGMPSTVDVELSEAVRAAYGLRRALVARTTTPDEQTQREHVGALAAQLLREVVVEDETLGVAWGRSLHAMTGHLHGLPRCRVVQLCGALPRPDIDAGSVELTRHAALASGGVAVTFYAPLVMADAVATRALRREPSIAAALRACDQLDTAVIAFGAWAPNGSTLYDAVGRADQQRLAKRGAVAESCGIVFDGAGRAISPGLSERVIGVTDRQLRRAGEVVALAYGEQKAPAVRAMLRGGLASTLVTHARLAEALLSGPD